VGERVFSFISFLVSLGSSAKSTAKANYNVTCFPVISWLPNGNREKGFPFNFFFAS
jgi:hypothetical protein